MAVFRIPLAFNRLLSFYKLLGCGKNGSFDKNPDWQQWAIMAVHKEDNMLSEDAKPATINQLYGGFIAGWLKLFGCETWTILLQPIEGHGSWDKKNPFGVLSKQPGYDGPVAVLTRATIRLSKLKAFWSAVNGVASGMADAQGFVCSVGIGEMPLVKQATFSVWQNREAMKAFAYGMKAHQEVIGTTRRDNWYSEDMFTRFRIIYSNGTIKGADPLAPLNNSAKFVK